MASMKTGTAAKTGPAISTQEIERKFIVNEMPELAGAKNVTILQGYIVVGSDGTEVRLRQKGDKYFQTVKADGGLVRPEMEIEITRDQFNGLWSTTEGRRVEKVRYEIAHGDAKIEFDVYSGKLAGLLIAEVEFPSIEASRSFAPPSWFGKEVTEDKRYKNKNLALEGLPV